MCIFKRKKEQTDTNEKTESDNNGWYWKTLGFVVITTIVLWGIAIFAAKCFDFGISDDSVAITVIGVVAGIVVIGNYAQVNEIKKDLDNRIKKVEKRQNEIILQASGKWTPSKEIQNPDAPADDGISESEYIKSNSTEIKEPKYPIIEEKK